MLNQQCIGLCTAAQTRHRGTLLIKNVLFSFFPFVATPSAAADRRPPCFCFNECTCFGSTYTKIGTIQRRLAWPLRKDDTQNREAFHIF